jgi:hypothetical protein
MNIRFITSQPNIEIKLKLDLDNDNDPMLIDVKDIVVDYGYMEIQKIKCEDANPAPQLDKDNKRLVEPNLILIVSGKRKTGKDYICQKIVNHLESNFTDFISIRVITLSSPLKKMYAIEHNLDFEKLLDSSDYKENYRMDMIR